MLSKCLLVIAIAVAQLSAGLAGQDSALPPIPELNITRFPAEVQLRVKQAYEEARENPKDGSASGRLGMLLQAYNLPAEAEVCYHRALLSEPTSFGWAYYLGLVQADQGKFDAAAASLGEALRRNPNYLPGELNLGECLLASGKWQEAAKLYEAIVAKHPDRAEVYYGLGRVQAVRKDLNGAARSFRKACDLFPNFGPAHYGLAHTYKSLGKTDLSLEQLALYEANRTSTPDARDQFLDDVRALKGSPPEQLGLGMELATEGKLGDAAAALEKALEANPQLVEAHVKLIALYAQLGQPLKAEGHFQAAARLDPRNAESYFSHGLLFASQGRFVEGEKAFRKALEINPQYPGAQLNLGNMLEAQGNLAGATALYQKILESNPGDSQAHFSLGRLLVNQENYSEGIQHFLKSVSAGDEEREPTYLYALGAAYARSGDRANASRYLHLAREKAAARGQSELVQSIDDDLRILETEGSPK